MRYDNARLVSWIICKNKRARHSSSLLVSWMYISIDGFSLGGYSFRSHKVFNRCRISEVPEISSRSGRAGWEEKG